MNEHTMEAVTYSRPYHFVVFGASGFTGKFVVEEVARYAAESTQDNRLTWAVAGRSGQRLKEMLKQAADRLGGYAFSQRCLAKIVPREEYCYFSVIHPFSDLLNPQVPRRVLFVLGGLSS